MSYLPSLNSLQGHIDVMTSGMKLFELRLSNLKWMIAVIYSVIS